MSRSMMITAENSVETVHNSQIETVETKKLKSEAYENYKKAERYMNKKYENLNSDDDFEHVYFRDIIDSFKSYGNCLKACDRYMNNIDIDSEESKNILDMSVEVEKKYNNLVEWYLRLPTEVKLKLINEKKSEIKIDKIDFLICEINSIPYFPVNEKRKILESFSELKKEIMEDYARVVTAGFPSLIGGVILELLLLYGFYLVLDYFLWSWLAVVLCSGMFVNNYYKYRQWSSINNIESKHAVLNKIKFFFGANSILHNNK